MVIKIRRLPSGVGCDMAPAVHPVSRCGVARLVGVAVWDCPLGAGANGCRLLSSCRLEQQRKAKGQRAMGLPGLVGKALWLRLGPDV